MPAIRRFRHRGAPATALMAVVLTAALASAGLASAASGSIGVAVTKKLITISGSRSAAKDVVQINYDTKKCASTYAAEVKRSTQFSDLRGTHPGPFKYLIKRKDLHLAKPTPNYACVYLIVRKGVNFSTLAAAKAKL